LLEDSCVYLLLNQAADVIVDAWRNWDVSYYPGLVRDSGHLDWGEEVLAEVSSLGVTPREPILEYSHKVVH
jgi:hypothetical protein